MSVFDTTIRVGEATAELLTDENGKSYEAHVIFGILAVAPVGNGQFLPIPMGVIRAPFNKKAIKGFIEDLQKVYGEMDERTDIETAANLSEAERIAKVTQGLR